MQDIQDEGNSSLDIIPIVSSLDEHDDENELWTLGVEPMELSCG